MATYWVDKNIGSDGGTGSEANPFATIARTVSIVRAGDKVRIEDGTYQESSNITIQNPLGIGHLNFNINQPADVIYEGKRGEGSNVIIQGKTSAKANVLFANNCSHIGFRYLTFTHRIASTLYILRSVNNLSDCWWEYCRFVQGGDGTTRNFGVQFDANPGKIIQRLRFSDCIWECEDAEYTAVKLGGDGLVKQITFDNPIVKAGFNGFNIDGAESILIESGLIESVKSTAIKVGQDADVGGKPSQVTLRNVPVNMAQAIGGHAVMIGNGAYGCLIDGLDIKCAFDIGLVLKAHTGTEVKNSRLRGGTSSAMFCKGAREAFIHGNVLSAHAGGNSGVFRADASDTMLCGELHLEENDLIAEGDATLLYWTEDLGGSISDYNRYDPRNGQWGNLRDTPLSGLSSLQTAWNGYNVIGNDQHSSVV